MQEKKDVENLKAAKKSANLFAKEDSQMTLDVGPFSVLKTSEML